MVATLLLENCCNLCISHVCGADLTHMCRDVGCSVHLTDFAAEMRARQGAASQGENVDLSRLNCLVNNILELV